MRRRMLLLIVFTLIAAACAGDPTGVSGSDDSTPESVTTSTAATTTEATTTTRPTTTTEAVAAGFPVTIAAGNGDVEIADRPTTIVSLSSTSTEILFAIGAGDQVAAVDEFSDYPPEAPLTELSGFSSNVEAIAEFEPDLVVLSFDPGGVEDSLEALGIPVLVHFTALTLDDTYSQIEQLGAATGNGGAAAELIGQIRAEIAAFVEEVGGSEAGFTYYHELDDTYYSATSATFIGDLYSLLGLVNIADTQDVDGFGFPQLSAEYIIESDPDFIFLADTKCCGQSSDTVAGRPGWANLSAVTGNGVIELDDDVASRWGPRVVEFIGTVAEAIRQLEGSSTG